jgi:hypothetical protein
MMVRECTSTCYVMFWNVVVPACDPKDLFMECVTMFIVQSTGLIWVGFVKYHVVFPVSWMFEVEGKDGVILTLGDRWCNPNLGTSGVLCRML